jgi:hypothetical protein
MALISQKISKPLAKALKAFRISKPLLFGPTLSPDAITKDGKREQH